MIEVRLLTYGNPIFDCDGAQIRALCRQLAIVVRVDGDIDSANVDRVSEYTTRFILPEKPFILDLSGAKVFSAESISLLFAVDEKCCATGVEWSLIVSRPVDRALRASGSVDLPTAGSVPEALTHYAEIIRARSRLLPLLTKTA
jgi:anti-anti-sigma regulatory factor